MNSELDLEHDLSGGTRYSLTLLRSALLRLSPLRRASGGSVIWPRWHPLPKIVRTDRGLVWNRAWASGWYALVSCWR
jgi:hypothetical protein